MRFDRLSNMLLLLSILLCFGLGVLISNQSSYFLYAIGCILFGVFMGADELPDDSAVCMVCQRAFHPSEGSWVCKSCTSEIWGSSHGKKKSGKS